jgi:hypothetical protein
MQRLLILVIGLGLAGCGTTPTKATRPSPRPTESPATSPSPEPVLPPPPTVVAPPPAAPAATIPVDLTFGGTVQGHASAGLSPHPHGTSDPRGGDHMGFTDWTQCADYSYDFNAGHTAHEWMAVVVVDLGGKL